MKILAIDPGVRNCGFVVLDDLQPIRWGGWFDYDAGNAYQRSTSIARSLQLLGDEYQVDGFVTEQFLGRKEGPQIANPSAFYGRGQFDAILTTMLGHLPQASIHPMLLKKFWAGKGNCKKEQVAETICSEVDIPFSVYSETCRGHIAEAIGLGIIGLLLWNNQFLEDRFFCPPKRKVILKPWSEKWVWHPPVLEDHVTLPPAQDDIYEPWDVTPTAKG